MWRCGSWKSPALVHLPLNQAARLFVVTHAWFWDNFFVSSLPQSHQHCTVETLGYRSTQYFCLHFIDSDFMHFEWSIYFFEVSLKSFLRMDDLLHASLLRSALLQIKQKERKKERKKKTKGKLPASTSDILGSRRCLHASLQKGMAVFKIWVDVTRRLFRKMRISLYF